MNRKIFFKIMFTTMIIIISSVPTMVANENENQNNNIINDNILIIKEKISQNINKISKITWYPGFFITLLLAPFILIYLIIAIILDIGNP